MPADLDLNELRIDVSDGNAYNIQSFIQVYGGSYTKPPCQWVTASSPADPADPVTFSAAEASVTADDDQHSIATTESQWLLIDAEEGDMPSDDEASNPGADVTDFFETEAIVAQQPAWFASGMLLAADPLDFGGSSLLKDGGYRGDVTVQWVAAVQEFPEVASAGIFCLGRIVVGVAATRSPSRAMLGLPAWARVALKNNGACAWPACTTLRCVAGDAFGFGELPIGPLGAGEGASLTMDFVLPAEDRTAPLGACPGGGSRSAWVLADGLGRPFGPLLTLEVVWEA